MNFLVLMYHNLSEKPRGQYAITPTRYRQQLESLIQRGYTVDDCDGLLKRLATMEFPEKYVVITFDDGHMSNLLADDITKELGCRATYFLPKNICQTWEGFMRADNIKRLAERASVGSHGVTHCALNRLSLAEIDSEMRDSKRWLEHIVQKSITTFSVPHGAIDKRIVAKGLAIGYQLIGNSLEWWNTPAQVARTGVVNRTMVYRSYDMTTFHELISLAPRFFWWRRARYHVARGARRIMSKHNVRHFSRWKMRITGKL